MAAKSSGGGGGSKFFDKRLILVILTAFALLVGVPAGLNTIAAVILFIAVIFVVYHNGVQISDAIVFIILGAVLSSTYVGDAARWVLDTASGFAASLPIAQ